MKSSYLLLPVVIVAGATACGSDGAIGTQPDAQCVLVIGSAQTIGDRDKLVGSGTFRFDGIERPVAVGVYFFAIVEDAEGNLLVETQYQFNFDDGDTFLSKDKVLFQPGMEEGEYQFSAPMTIISGAGIFRKFERKHPLNLEAIIHFGPTPDPGTQRSAQERLTIGGTLCGI